jgi:mono/diheme cytochrome c family protein
MRIAFVGTVVMAFLGGRVVMAQEPVTYGEGAQVYAVTCARCHNARGPMEHSDRDWVVIMNHMRTRALLSGRDTRAVLLFLRSSNGTPVINVASALGHPPTARSSAALSPTANDAPVSRVAEPDAGPVKKLPVPTPPDTATVAKGRQLVEKKACTACHKIGKHTTGTLGPDLNTVLKRRAPAWILDKLENPTFDNPASQMPQMHLPTEERESILLYIQSVAKK